MKIYRWVSKYNIYDVEPLSQQKPKKKAHEHLTTTKITICFIYAIYELCLLHLVLSLIFFFVCEWNGIVLAVNSHIMRVKKNFDGLENDIIKNRDRYVHLHKIIMWSRCHKSKNHKMGPKKQRRWLRNRWHENKKANEFSIVAWHFLYGLKMLFLWMVMTMWQRIQDGKQHARQKERKKERRRSNDFRWCIEADFSDIFSGNIERNNNNKMFGINSNHLNEIMMTSQWIYVRMVAMPMYCVQFNEEITMTSHKAIGICVVETYHKRPKQMLFELWNEGMRKERKNGTNNKRITTIKRLGVPLCEKICSLHFQIV